MSLEIKSKGVVPPGGYVYIDPDSKQVFKHPHFNQLEIFAKKHRRANDFPIGANWSEQFEENVCRNSPAADCGESEPLPPLVVRASKLAKALTKWAVEGFKVTSEEEYNQRIAICEQCEYFTGSKNILSVSCRKCGCSGLKPWLKSGGKSCPLNKW